MAIFNSYVSLPEGNQLDMDTIISLGDINGEIYYHIMDIVGEI